MRELRRQLISLIDATLKEQGDVLGERAAACLVRDSLSLLSQGRPHQMGVRFRTITRGDLHRHLITIRCPDQAFFLDGIKVYLARQGIQPLGQQAVVYCASYDDQGAVSAICPPDVCATGNEMLVALHVSATLVPDGDKLFKDLSGIVHAVQASVRDYRAMDTALNVATEALVQDDVEAASLLAWMTDANYLLFGMAVNGKRYGILSNRRTLSRVAPGLWEDLASLPTPEQPGIAWLYLPHAQNFVYGASQLEVVRICWRERNRLVGATLLGYFARSARNTNASQVPLLSQVWNELLTTPALTRSAYLSREIRTLFDRIPKPVLLSVPPEELLATLRAIIDVGTPEKTLLFPWHTPPGEVRLMLVVMAAIRFTHDVEQAILATLKTGGFIPLHHQNVAVGQHQLMFVSCRENGTPPSSLENLRQAVQECAISWHDRARAAIRAHASGDETPAALGALASVPRVYTDLFEPETFVHDLEILKRIRQDARPHVRIERTTEGLDIHLFTTLPVPLGKLVTIATNFGLSPLKEVVMAFPGDPLVHLTSLTCTTGIPVQPDDLPRLKEALEAVLDNAIDNDPANALILLAGLDLRAVMVLIALRGHLVQLMPSAAPEAVSNTFLRYPMVAAALYRVFAARHTESGDIQQQAQRFADALDDVQSLNEDTWFRAMGELADAGLRSNAFVRALDEPIAIKIDPNRLSFAPYPRPYREIFVHGRHVQGVHLRGGPVARGGLRLSDRPADFRTEVLELMATQVIKNGIIVPTGAKGGFVVKGGAGSAFIQSQYRAYIRALLSVTDNRIGKRVLPPEGIVIAPEDRNDPYLVVAADKGTATFSDLANAEAEAAGFWLDDAFASGGSHGYDHKAYGITARGAWVCVRHHFAAMGIDPNREPITVTAIGDMGGDVFGNGMLQSRTLRLIAAFNHAHIFLDPDPDPEIAYRERQRLFEQRGGWDQYDPQTISKGGGVFSRSAKRVAISPQVAEALGIPAGDISGEKLVQAILTAPVDLLYNGGIGTYVRASDERDDEVRDPANNAVRVGADRLRCRVIGEGGNLGLTQRARIEFAAAGGRINTDATDNSGGVDMSDHEVNLKILLATTRNIPSRTRRNRLLASLGDEITELCLAGNLAQARALSLAERETRDYPPRVRRLRDRLVAEGHLDPATHPGMDEPGEATLALRPQLAVLLGCEKNRIKAALARDDFARQTPFRDDLLNDYFPDRVTRRHQDGVQNHPLADEIVNTVATNGLVERFGMFALSHLETLINATTSDVAQGLMAADYVLKAAHLRTAIWHHVADLEQAIIMQLALQSHLQHFAEELLRLSPAGTLSKAWMHEQRGHFVRFRHLIEGETKGQDGENVCLVYDSAIQAGLSESDAAWLCAMPHLARSGVALQAGARTGIPLSRCLAANRTVFRQLPFLTVEMQLRNPSWGTDLSHALRGEWLNRLTHMRSRAVVFLLETRSRDLDAAGRRIWRQHPHWRDIATLAEQMDSPTEDPMRVILLLTRLESLIDDITG